MVKPVRRLPFGAECTPTGRVHFRVWTTTARRVEVVLEADGTRVPLEPDGAGCFEGSAPGGAGLRYRYSLDGSDPLPDPASRFQPEGPHGPSEVIDPGAYQWRDGTWSGPDLARPVLYELHVGTFTPEGTWRAAAAQLEELADLGISIIELMPVAAFPGRFGWGYDGVDLFAPSQLYGAPDELRAFIARAHQLGLGVILDVVYNHVGPDGCYLREFAPEYFSRHHRTDWGDGLNFDEPGSGPVRQFVIANAAHWIAEYHFDGLRLDATQSIFDDSTPHILTEIAAAVRTAAGGRRTFLVVENEPQNTDMLRSPEHGGHGMDAAWNDDFHHTARVAATGRAEAYYSDYRGTPQELISALRWGYLYQGQHYRWQKQARGMPAFDLQPRNFVNFLQNHDQVANSAAGLRLHQLTSPARYRALTALLLLGPGSPMLLQGQEYGASTPFLFFADHEPELAAQVRRGRAEFLAQFPSIASPAAQRALPRPDAEQTFRRCVLDPEERRRNTAVLALHRDLIGLSRRGGFRCRDRDRVHGAVLGPDCFLLRWLGDQPADDRLLLVNLGADRVLSPQPEPLLAPPPGRDWRLAWSSEDRRYGGHGVAPVLQGAEWHLPAESALVFSPPGEAA